MALNSYLAQVQALLQTPPAPNTLYSTALLTTYINLARSQIAGEASCVQAFSTFNTSVGMSNYSFTALSVSTVAGISSVITVNQVWASIVGLSKWVTPRPWEYYSIYSNLNNPVSQQGIPDYWAQYSRGLNGAIYFEPIPDQVYSMTADCVCIPINLASDSDPEAIPYPYTDCIPFLSTYWALLSAQSAARQDDANRMYQRYKEFLARAQNMATPMQLPFQYDSDPDEALSSRARLGIDTGPEGAGSRVGNSGQQQ